MNEGGVGSPTHGMLLRSNTEQCIRREMDFNVDFMLLYKSNVV